MDVLVACEFSGAVRDEFAKRGHNAWSCDFEDSEAEGNHIKGDVRPHLRRRWDLVIAHPTCTRICNSGVRWLRERNLWDEMRAACEFFVECLNANSDKVIVENPIPHKYALDIIGRKYDQIIHPWQFGHGETKATCLWLKGVKPLVPTCIVEGREARVHLASPGKDRWKVRSRTYKGFAQAMAAQWG